VSHLDAVVGEPEEAESDKGAEDDQADVVEAALGMIQCNVKGR
jgi:hypothetical protein